MTMTAKHEEIRPHEVCPFGTGRLWERPFRHHPSRPACRDATSPVLPVRFRADIVPVEFDIGFAIPARVGGFFCKGAGA